jgi:hypothetical protein
LQIVKDLESAYNESVYFKTLEGIPIMKTKIIPVAADNEKDVITLQKIATKSFTAMFGPYHEPKPLKHILMRHMP